MTAAPTAAPRRNDRWVYLALLGGLGMLFAWYSWSQFSEHRALSGQGRQVEAVVAGYDEVRGRRSTTTYPVFDFTTAEGRRVRATSGVSADPAELRRGSRVLVAYDPSNPNRVRQASAVAGGPGFTPWLLGFLALAMFALAGVFLLPPRAGKPS